MDVPRGQVVSHQQSVALDYRGGAQSLVQDDQQDEDQVDRAVHNQSRSLQQSLRVIAHVECRTQRNSPGGESHISLHIHH